MRIGFLFYFSQDQDGVSDYYFRRDVVNQNLTGWKDKSDTIPRLLWVDETSVKDLLGLCRFLLLFSFLAFVFLCVCRSNGGRPPSIVVQGGGKVEADWDLWDGLWYFAGKPFLSRMGA